MNRPVQLNRDLHKSYRFLVYFDTSTTPVAGVSKVSSLKRSSDAIEYKEGGNAIIRKGLGRHEIRADHDGARRDLRPRLRKLGERGASTGQRLAHPHR